MVFERFDFDMQADELDAVLVILNFATDVINYAPAHIHFLLDRFDLFDSQTIDA
jgi:hypothetical protein